METERAILHCQTNSQVFDINNNQRRSANYKPNVWNYDFLESLNSEYYVEKYRTQAEKYTENVKEIFDETKELQSMLELVDSLRKLGLAHKFEKEIKKALDTVASTENSNPLIGTDLYLTSLYFRLLRQHGYQVSQDLFSRFMGENGLLKKITLNIKGMLELFEASNLALEGEHILEEAKSHTFETLKSISISDLDDDCEAAKLVAHSLEVSLQWRVHWFDVRWQINAYEKDKNMNNVLLQLAKLNFNVVQAIHQKDLKESSRWDVSETEELPECMKLCFQSLYDTTNEIANEIEMENGWKQVLPHLHKAWADFCKSLFVEAEWYHKGYTPSLQEYLSNACISSSGPVLLLHSFFSEKYEAKQEMINFLEKNHDLVYQISLLIRLCNDLGTSAAEQERGDAPSSIVCYMQEMNVSEDIAQKHIKGMVSKTWQKINEKSFSLVSSLPSLVNVTTNVARVAHSLYQSGDGITVQDRKTKNKFLSLVVEPFELK
ncbi:hypothetical protein FEM48_Zijuj01G0136800 [Ziziphus jujuba var. spinosa]|uniref:Alpha-farnesene synthase-like n=1 Tax=Ziziphus jujuba var. spinosa TaxID=714518 RepID=A0A978W1L0_ZIZJJ|nr:hypothetical protein FEM48_Zijuj01G0136800 [Ziziphus jujuba var. spinosa]